MFECRLNNSIGELARATNEVNGFLDARAATADACFVVNLALEEIVTNIIKYGYDDGAVHEIIVRITPAPGLLELCIEDDGHPFNPLDAAKPDLSKPVEDRDPGGLGIYLIIQMTRQVAYERSGGLNSLVVTVSN